MHVQCTAIEFNRLLPLLKEQQIYLLSTIDDASEYSFQFVGGSWQSRMPTPAAELAEHYQESAVNYYTDDPSAGAYYTEDLFLHWTAWMTTLAVARLFGYSSGRSAAALMERVGTESTKVGRWVLYDRRAVERLKARFDETLSMSEASRRVGLKGPRGLYPYVVSGRIKATEVAGHLHFELGELERFMEQMSPVGAVSRKRKPMEK